ncbi:hypothetical protein QNO00_13925 [Arthrobacter sp. zg-Y1219]|uniref:hypothetical protein n=1 Tax=Arthrobacter sp. zg-Y1219 TaxID=3049067 RepID=UPI0024C2D178|nr:hypothetical protein [Arthrobacter sp. zg-Y1219]MDK1361358.1 hypothetical protein [Arthrobacter sp. zg-Y1219]
MKVDIFRHRGVLAIAGAVAMVSLAAGCSSTESSEDNSTQQKSERPVLGVCEILGTMQECANTLTDIYMEVDEAYERLDSPTANQTAALERMNRASEIYSTSCRGLDVRAGAEVNMVNGCDDALDDIVTALSSMR